MSLKSNSSVFVRTMAWSQIGRISEIGLGFIFNILVIRQLTTAEYGAYNTFLNLAITLNIITSLGLPDSLQRFVPEARKAPIPFHLGLLRRFLFLRLLAGMGLGLGLILFGPVLADLFNLPLINEQVWLLVGLLISLGLLDMFLSYYLATFRLREMVAIRTGTQLLNLLAILVWFQVSSPSGVAVLMITTLSTTLACVFYLWRLPAASLYRGQINASLKHIFRFSRDLWIVNLSNFSLSGYMDVLIIGLVVNNPNEVAYYALAALVISRVQSLIWGWFSTLSSVVATIQLERGQEGLISYFSYYYRFNLLTNLAVVGYLFVAAGPIILLVFGTKYEPSITLVLAYLIYWITIGLQGGGIAYGFANVTGKHQGVLRERVIFGLLNIGLDIALVYWLGALGAVIASSISSVGTHLVELILVRSLLSQISFGFIVKICLSVMIATILSYPFAGNSLGAFLVSSTIYGLTLLLALKICKPLSDGDRQLLKNWKPAVQYILKYF